MTPIAKAVEPLKARTVAAAQESAREFIERIRAKVTAADGNLDVIAPYPRSTLSRPEYVKMKKFRDLVQMLAVRDKARMDAQGYQPHPTYYVVMDYIRCEHFVEDQMTAAAASYEAFVAKLEAKVGEHVACTMIEEGTWQHSLLAVTKPDGTVERWKTQMILNVSILGTLFNQWPTRRVK